MKRFAGLILVFVMLLSALPALADETRTSGDFQYTLKSNGTATIVGYTGSGDSIIIPQMLDGYTVTAIGDEAFDNSLGLYGYGNKTYSSVTLPDTIKSIGEFAFRDTKITSINLPNDLEDIGKWAFVGCNSIAYRMSANHPTFAVIDGALYNKSQKKLIWGKEDATIPEGIKIIGDYACYEVPNCGINGNGIVLPSTIEEIGDYAFYGNKYWIFLPQPSVKYIDTYTFVWGENLQKIGKYAFQNVDFSCTVAIGSSDYSYVNFKLPNRLVEIGEGCFSDCYSNHDFYFVIEKNSQLRKIPSKAFYQNSHSQSGLYFNCAAPITEIGAYAFEGINVVSIDMQNVKTLDKGAFMGSYLHSDITIPASCKVVPADAFNNARTLGHDIVISNGVEVIEANALNVNLTEETAYKTKVYFLSPIRLPTSLTSIAPDAFRDDAEFIVERGSYAYRWADENARNYSIDGEKQNLDWLNN